jgi:diguanylate cyclase (GGDEF)-like protein/PAS domain S-box-containing protein
MGRFLVRHLLPAVIVVPIVLGWLRLEGERAGLYGTGFGVVLMTAANVLISSALVLGSARMLDRLEDKRRQVEQKYRGIFENAAEGIFQTTLDGCLLTANPAMARMFGYESPEEMISLISNTGKQLWVSVDDRAEYVRRLREQGVIVGTEVRMKRKDGSVVWVSANVRALKDADGKPVLLEGTLEDITQRRQAEEALRKSRARFRSLIQNSSDIITLLEVDGTIRYESPSIERILGYEPEELVGENVFDYVHPEDLERVLEVLAEGLADPKLRPSVEYRFRHKDGSWRWLESIGANLLDDPDVGELVVNSRDITERKLAEEALQEAEQRFRSSFRDAAVGMALVGTDGRWLQVNRSLCEITGYSEEELLTKTCHDITHPDDLETNLHHVRRLLAGEIETYQMEKRYFHKEGYSVWLLLNVSLVRDTRGRPRYFIAQIQDISERKRMEAKLQHQASHDALTGLPNRILFTDRLKHALARTARDRQLVAVLFMDLNNFKIVNDSLGHETGDKLLIAVAQRLRACLRPGDTVGRLGGDEFAILLEDLPDGDYPTTVASRIIEELRGRFAIGGREVFVNASIGIAISNLAGRDRPDVLMRDADAAMYAAKGNGGSRYAVFDQSMNHRALRRLDLENDLIDLCKGI